MEIKIENLSKKFDHNHVLKDINLVIQKNKSTIILGKSGCGKSVLLKLIYQLIKSDEGSIIYDKKKFVDIDKFGMLFQYGALFDSLTIAENIAFIDFIDSKKNYRNKVINSLKEVGLSDDIYNKYPSEISGGMKKRVSIARAIVNSPKYLFCDEPNSGLDPKTATLIDQLIQEITRENNITTVVVTHDMNSVMEIGEKIVFLKNGKLVWQGSNLEIFKTDNKDVTDFVYSSDLFKKIRNIQLNEH